MFKLSSRTLLALCLAVVLLSGIASVRVASADSPTYASTQDFLSFLDSKEVKYSFEGMSNNNYEIVSVKYRLDNFSSLECRLFFHPDGDEVGLRIWNIITNVAASKNYTCTILNDLNCKYKYVKFVYDDSDNTVQGEMDLLIDPNHCGQPIYTAMRTMFNVIDDNDIAASLKSLE